MSIVNLHEYILIKNAASVQFLFKTLHIYSYLYPYIRLLDHWIRGRGKGKYIGSLCQIKQNTTALSGIMQHFLPGYQI